MRMVVWLAPEAASNGTPALRHGGFTVYARHGVITFLAVAALVTVPHAQPGVGASQLESRPPEQSAPVADAPPASDGLGDLGTMTFSCPKAALNTAAREAAKVPSQGTYQFSYFRIVSDSHHAAYEIHFKSNHEGEADLKYCVSLYCQQGWDPKTTKTSVTSMNTERRRVPAAAHGAE